MAGGRLILPAADPCITSAGLLNSGAVLTVFNTGTSVLADIYADPDLTTPILNPQYSNQAGRFYTQSTQICADATAAYDVELAFTDGETFTYDQVYCLGPAPTITGFAPLNSPAFTGTPTAPTPAANDASSKLATTQFVATAIAAVDVFPTGMYGYFAMTSLPSGWIVCNGAAISRTIYAALFGAIGTTYGSGDGSTTFNLPNFEGYFPRGLNPGGSGPDPSRSLGSVQTDQYQGHVHYSGVATNSSNGIVVYSSTTTGMPGSSSGNVAQNAGSNTNQPITGVSLADGTNGTPRVGTETRPTNLAVVIAIHV
jgi:microcystin-dependent protein